MSSMIKDELYLATTPHHSGGASAVHDRQKIEQTKKKHMETRQTNKKKKKIGQV